MGESLAGVEFQTFKNAGSSSMKVDGSSTPVAFEVSPPSGKSRWKVIRLNVLIMDGNQTPTKFGGLSALTNGLLVQGINADGDVAVDFLDGETIKQNADWVLLAGTDNPVTAAAGDDQFSARWTIQKGINGPLILGTGEKLRITVQDDLTGLTSFRIMAQGEV